MLYSENGLRDEYRTLLKLGIKIRTEGVNTYSSVGGERERESSVLLRSLHDNSLGPTDE